MAQRADLLAEISTTLDGSGNFAGTWIDSGGVKNVRVIHSSVGVTPQIDESSDQSVILGNTTVSGGYAEAPLTARYFRLTVSGGTANATFRAVLRAVN